ncbi:zinc-ribbon domain-containing protein [Frankia sp. AvcI1]|uniref:zinc-ribbon domain-containing protein n=1 Tax=Frankia alni TaxID=1859 RepID=UPI002740CA6B
MPAGFANRQESGRPRWVCPLDDHHTWEVWPKDRISRGTRCPACQKKGVIADVALLLDQWDDEASPDEVTLGSNREVSWKHETWTVVPETGEWRKVTHHWRTEPKVRTGQLDACLVCAGHQVDETTSLKTWFPTLARELVSSVDAATLSPGSHDGGTARYEWRCLTNEKHPNWRSTILNRVNDTGCPRCRRRGVSDRQARIAAEIDSLGALIPPDDRLGGLPGGVPDLCSYQLDIPSDVRERYQWRYSKIEIDMLIDAGGRRIAVEYDGAAYHASRFRDDDEIERRKDGILRALGLPVIRVREQGLTTPVRKGLWVIEINRDEPWSVAVKIFDTVRKITGWMPTGLRSYRLGQANQGEVNAGNFLAAYREPRERGPRPPRSVSVPRPRRPRSTIPAGTKIGHLTVRSDAIFDKNSPPRSTQRWNYKVDCACGATNVSKTHADLTRNDGRRAKFCSRQCPLITASV